MDYYISSTKINWKVVNKWSNYGKWRHPEKRKELMKIDVEDFNRKAQHIVDTVVKPQVERYELIKNMEKTITSDTHSNRLKDDIRSEFNKIKWMIDEHIQVQGKQIKFRDELIELLTNQVVDLTMMSKIELGDDVIAEIKRLQDIINE